MDKDMKKLINIISRYNRMLIKKEGKSENCVIVTLSELGIWNFVIKNKAFSRKDIEKVVKCN